MNKKYVPIVLSLVFMLVMLALGTTRWNMLTIKSSDGTLMKLEKDRWTGFVFVSYYSAYKAVERFPVEGIVKHTYTETVPYTGLGEPIYDQYGNWTGRWTEGETHYHEVEKTEYHHNEKRIKQIKETTFTLTVIWWVLFVATIIWLVRSFYEVCVKEDTSQGEMIR